MSIFYRQKAHENGSLEINSGARTGTHRHSSISRAQPQPQSSSVGLLAQASVHCRSGRTSPHTTSLLSLIYFCSATTPRAARLILYEELITIRHSCVYATNRKDVLGRWVPLILGTAYWTDNPVGFKKNVNRATTQVMMKTGTYSHAIVSSSAARTNCEYRACREDKRSGLWGRRAVCNQKSPIEIKALMIDQTIPYHGSSFYAITKRGQGLPWLSPRWVVWLFPLCLC